MTAIRNQQIQQLVTATVINSDIGQWQYPAVTLTGDSHQQQLVTNTHSSW